MKKKILSMIVAFTFVIGGTSYAPVAQTNAKGNTEIKGPKAQELEDLFTTIDIMDASIEDLQSEMTAGHVTAEQLAQMYIDRINTYDQKLKLNSIISINPNALSDAAALDKERSEGKVRGPLHGIPIVVKANYDVAGMANSAGSRLLADNIVSTDSYVVKKLKDAGAVILAQANLSEFAFSAADSISTLGDNVHNAYDGDKTPAGSSGGTAVAVTCNFAAAGLGTDTGGSIRNPSSFSNLYGIRPSKGLTSIDGVIPLNAERDTTGPIARTAEDMALMLQTMAGTDAKDDYTQEADADALVGDGYMDSLSPDALKGKKIGYLESSFLIIGEDEEGNPTYTVPNARIQSMMNKTLSNLRKAGATLVDLYDVMPDDDVNVYAAGATGGSFEYDMNKYLHDKGDEAPFNTVKDMIFSGEGINYFYLSYYVDDPDNLADSFEETVNTYTEDFGGYKRSASWEDTLAGRDYVSQVMEENDIDAVMYLWYYNAVPDLTSDQFEDSDAGYGYLFGPAMGLPEMSIPMGFSDTDGEYTSEMPLGLNIFSDFGHEETLMEIAYAYEQQAGDIIRKMPERVPAIEDENLNEYLENLMDDVYSIDYAKYNKKPEGKVQLMLNAYDKAKDVDLKDPYATYDAAAKLARAYDRVMAALEESGLVPDAADVKDEVVVGAKVSSGNLYYKVTSVDEKNRTVAVTGMKNKKKTVATIPATIKINDVTYKVTAIAVNAFKANKSLKKVTIGKNVKTIGKNAFLNCSNLKTINVKTNVLKKVNAKALKGINKKAVIKVPAKKKKAYKKLFKKKGQASTVTIK